MTDQLWLVQYHTMGCPPSTSSGVFRCTKEKLAAILPNWIRDNAVDDIRPGFEIFEIEVDDPGEPLNTNFGMHDETEATPPAGLKEVDLEETCCLLVWPKVNGEQLTWLKAHIMKATDLYETVGLVKGNVPWMTVKLLRKLIWHV